MSGTLRSSGEFSCCAIVACGPRASTFFTAESISVPKVTVCGSPVKCGSRNRTVSPGWIVRSFGKYAVKTPLKPWLFPSILTV